MSFQEFKFEDLPNIMAEILPLLSELKVLRQTANSPAKPTADIIGVSEAAEMLGLTIPTIYSKVSRKELPYSKRGNKVYFSREELTAFIKGGRIPTKEEAERAAFRKSGEAMLRSQKGAEA